ncbi:MAG: LysR family transcriptional regulator [marine bacterium B5-7]|nr:MAG: LysR family transcriptional regulator [marine bacterium B5-7]
MYFNTYMKFKFDVRWLISDTDKELDQRLLPLLSCISETGSLQTSAKVMGLSYRTAWGIIRYWNEAFGSPLCNMERGRGTQLSLLGKELLQTKRIIEAEYFTKLHENASQLNKRIEAFTDDDKQKLSAYTSHDLAITYLQSICSASSHLDIEFYSQGSLDSLKLLNSPQADIVGFHFPEGPLADILAAKYAPWLDDDKHILIQLAIREQGLMLNPAKTKHIKSLKDLTRRSIRFLNRQKGSGTRAIFDELIKLHGINKKQIGGYEKEEFTHTAVAAMISSGHADVGFGLKAAAVEFKLSFIPLITENYVIAVKKSLPNNITESFRNLMKDDKLKSKINKLPGYSSRLTGKVIHAHKLLSMTNT